MNNLVKYRNYHILFDRKMEYLARKNHQSMYDFLNVVNLEYYHF